MTKDKKPSSFTARLARYSAMAGAALAAGTSAQGAVQYQSVNTTISNSGEEVSIDFDGDASNEITINLKKQAESCVNSMGNPCVPPGGMYLCTNCSPSNESLYVKRVGTGTAFIRGGGFDIAGVLNSGDSISAAATWTASAGNTDVFLRNNAAGNTAGNWNDKTDKYLGVKFKIGANTHYGWVRLTVSGDITSATVTGYAYDDTPDTTITAGAVPVGSAPTIAIDNGTLSYTAGDAITQIDAAATADDADGDADWDGGTLTVGITANAEAADEISIPDNIVGTINTDGTNLQDGAVVIGTLSNSEGTVTNNTVLTITFNNNATNALVQEVVQAIHYRNTSGTPGSSNRTVTYTVTDKNSRSATDTRTIVVTSANDTPTIAIDNTNLSYAAGDAATQIDPAATAGDADGDAEWDGGTLAVGITANAEAADEISIPDNIAGTINTTGTNLQDGVTVIGTLSASEGTVTNNTVLTITFNNNATNALVQNVVRAVHYRSTSGTPGTSNRTITFTLTDKNSRAANDTRTIAVSAGNTAPVLDASATPVFTNIDEDVAAGSNSGDTVADIVVNGSVTDADGGAVEAIAVTAVDNTNGMWQFSTDNGITWIGFSGTTGVVDLSATSVLLDTTDRIRFMPEADYSGSGASITFRAWDKTTGSAGNTADTTTNGGTSAFSSVTDTSSITVDPVNDAPTAMSLSPSSVNENLPAGTVIGTFGTTDPDN